MYLPGAIGWQAVHKFYFWIASEIEHVAIYLKMTQLVNALGKFVLFAHRHPDIRVNHVRALQSFLKIVSDRDARAALSCQLVRPIDERLLRE